MYIDMVLVEPTEEQGKAKALLKEILTEDQLELHEKCKEALKIVNWKAEVEELPVVEWRRKVARY